MKPTRAGPYIFVSKKDKKLILAIHIDDGLIAAEETETADELLQEMKKKFQISSEELGMYLGLQIDQRKDKITLHQSAYATKILERFRMLDANPVAISADSHNKSSTQLDEENKDSINQIPYREAVGSLLYLSIGTRPDHIL